MSILPTAKTQPKPDLADLTVLVYGQTKIGKSTFCSQSDRALFLATEPGLNALDVYQVPIQSWEELGAQPARKWRQGQHPFKTVVIDTIDNAYKFCTDYIVKKHKIEHESDLGYGKGYALVNNEFQRVLTKLAFLPYGLFLISHAKETEIDTLHRKVHTRHPPLCRTRRGRSCWGWRTWSCTAASTLADGEGNEKVLRRVIRTKAESLL